MKPVPHGEPYAGKLHVRFDEWYPPKNGEARFEGSRRPSGRTLRGRPALLYTLLATPRPVSQPGRVSPPLGRMPGLPMPRGGGSIVAPNGTSAPGGGGFGSKLLMPSAFY